MQKVIQLVLMPISQIGVLVLVPATLLSMQLLANVSWGAASDGLNALNAQDP